MISLLRRARHAPVPPPKAKDGFALSQALAFDADGIHVIPWCHEVKLGSGSSYGSQRPCFWVSEIPRVSCPRGASERHAQAVAKVRHFVIAEQYPIDQSEQAQRHFKY